MPHFTKFLLTKNKRAEFELFKQGVSYLKDKKSLSLDNIKYLSSIKASMGRGLSDKL